MNSSPRNSIARLMLIALAFCMPFMLAGLSAATSALQFTEAFNFSTQAGSAQAMGWDATKVRNMAYKEGKLYMVYDVKDIKVVESQTGEYLYDLDKTAVSGGYFSLCDVGVFDGKVVACNLKVPNTTQPLKVYVWDSDESAPRVVLNTTNYGGADRIGDCMSFQGTWNDGRIIFARDDGTTTRIISYKVQNGVCSTTPTVINATINGRRYLPCGLSVRVHADSNGYWINGTDSQLTRLDTTGKRLYAAPESNEKGNAFDAFVYQDTQYALMSTYVGSRELVGGAMNLVDASGGWQYIDVIGTYPAAGLGTTTNTNGTSAVIAVPGSNYIEAWVLSSLQGIAYYKHGNPPSYGEPGTPSLSVSPASLDFGSVTQNQSKQMTFSVSTENLTQSISISSNNSAFTVNPSTLGSGGGTVTVTFKPTAQTSYTAGIMVSSPEISSRLVSASGLGVASIPVLSLTERFNISENKYNASSKGWDATNIRNMTYHNGKLYLVHNHQDIKVVKSQTGDYLYDLDKTNVSAAAIALCDVSIIDGKVIACNLASNGQTLKVYIWDNDQATARELLSTTDFGGATRLGDCIGYTGTLSNGKLSFAHDDGTTTRIVNYSINNGVANPTPTVVSATTESGAHLYCSSSIRVQPDATGYWIDGKGSLLTRLDSNGKRQYTVPQSKTHGNAFVPFTYNGVQYGITSTFIGPDNYVGGAMELLDARNGWASATVLATYPSSGLGTSLNTGTTGSVCANAGSNYVEAWVLCTLQGVAYYAHGTPPTHNYDVVDPEPELDPVITTSRNSLAFGEIAIGQSNSLTFTVTGKDLSGSISVSSNSSRFTVSPSTLGNTGGTVTITFSPLAAQTYTGTITLSATGAADKTVAVNGKGKIVSGDYPTEIEIEHSFTKSFSWNSENKSRDIAYHNGKIYAIENNEAASVIHAINATTGNEITSENVSNAWFNAFSVANDGTGNLFVPTNNSGGASNFLLTKLALPSSVMEINNHLSVGAGLRTDYIDAYKATDNVTYIAGATVNESPRRVRVWTVNQYGVVSATRTFLFPSDDNSGTGGDVKWINASRMLVTGASKKPTVLTLNMTAQTFTQSVVNTSTISFGGGDYFTVYGVPYVVLPTNGFGAFKVLDISTPSSPVSVANITSAIGSVTNGAAHVGIETVKENDNTVSIYVWSPNNGLTAYKMSFPYQDYDPGNEPEDPEIPDDDEEEFDDGSLQREMRAMWLAQVGVDWPSAKATSAAGRAAQQKEITDYMDEMKAANFNAVFFHIRSMADRSYALSSTANVPWSHYLTNTRGQDPGYDPLRFAIDEAHKRGMELHGWMNPYRYHPTASIPSAMSSWVFTYPNGRKIFNPGIPAVRQHIADATRDVVQNYPDIDGIVWDDYFYEDGTTDAMDQTAYVNYNPKGLGRGDWRRDNINQTIEMVYNVIQAANPGIRFGISPRGIWGIKQADANQHGVILPPGITGADNYNGIYTDGIAWLKHGTIDYISPQLYWATYPTGAAGQDYNKLAPWWQSVADKFNRHFYSSMGLYRFFPEDEYGREIAKNREVNHISPGSVFFSMKNLALYDDYIKNNYFQDMILPPAITWKAGSTKPPRVDNVRLSGSNLLWDSSMPDGSYAIFAVPKELGVINIKNCDYMVHRAWTNNNSYALGSLAYLANSHSFAVAAVNRYNMMSKPKFEARLTTGMTEDSTEATYRVFANQNGLNIKLKEAQPVTVYSINGIPVYQGTVDNELVLPVPQGVYIVQIAGEVVKVIR